MVLRAGSQLLRLTQFRPERLFSMETPGKPRFLRSLCAEACSSYTRQHRRLWAAVLLAGLLAPASFFAFSPAAFAQTAERVVQGKVELASGGMAKGAIVYIKNEKTLEVRTYISTDDGSYRFGQLNADADYTVWATFEGKKSKEKTISSFDTKKVLNILLKIEA